MHTTIGKALSVATLGLFATAIAAASAHVVAASPTSIENCPPGYLRADVDISVTLSTTLDCPLLENKDLRRYVNKFGVGSTFAYPAVPGTCMSGTNLVGTLTVPGRTPIEVTGYTRSAQMQFAEAEEVGDLLMIAGISQTGIPFASGAAMTVASLRGRTVPLKLDLVFSDRFTVDYSPRVPPFIDTEDFVIVGSGGDLSALGRLTGKATIEQAPGLPISDALLEVTGTICLK